MKSREPDVWKYKVPKAGKEHHTIDDWDTKREKGGVAGAEKGGSGIHSI